MQELYDEDEGVDINSKWSRIKDAVNSTCEEIIAEGNPQQKDWISVGNSSERAHISKYMKTSVKTDKRTSWRDLHKQKQKRQQLAGA